MSANNNNNLLARTGRHRQRYENNVRLVSGCIPNRVAKEREEKYDIIGEMGTRIEVLMVSSPNRADLVFPKGGWEDDETLLEAANREALEEAGVRGILRENPLGVWEFRSKSRQEQCSQEGGCKGYMFALEVTEELECWPERANRHRKWLKIEEAFELCRYEWMREALERFRSAMAEEEEEDEDKNIPMMKEDDKVQVIETQGGGCRCRCQVVMSASHSQPPVLETVPPTRVK